MASITTKDGMYTGNKAKSYVIDNTAYSLNIAYMYKPDFTTGSREEIAYAKYEIPSSDVVYKSTNKKIKLISEIFKELGNEEDSVVTSQGGMQEAAALITPGQSSEMHFGTGNRGTCTTKYDSQNKMFILELKYVTGFENFTIKDNTDTYNTVANFTADTTMDKKINDINKKYNFTFKDGNRCQYSNNDVYMNINVTNENSDTDGKDKLLQIELPFVIPDKDTDAFKVIYESLQALGVNNKMTVADMSDYINSLSVYSDNQKDYITSLPLNYYMPPVSNINNGTGNAKDGISIAYIEGSQLDQNLTMIFNIPVTTKNN